MQLDQSQKAFIEANPGNIRLLAPAGCGKTLCLLHRCNHLAKQSSPNRVRFLLVTFTRAAAEELRRRVNENAELQLLRGAVDITTLNAWGFRRIKNARFYPKLLTSRTQYHFAVQNQLQPVWKKHDLVRHAVEQRRRNENPRIIMDCIDHLKSMGFSHKDHKNYDDFANHWNSLISQGLSVGLAALTDDLTRIGIVPEEPIYGQRIKHIYDNFFRFWREAVDHLIAENTITLEDQKYVAWLDEQSMVEQGSYLSGAARYDHVVVDEFQDINPLDIALIKAIIERNKSTLTIAGDDDQAIFEWRGATPAYILDPDQHFNSQFKTHILATNYRSPKNIIERSQQLISHNTSRVAKKIAAGPANPEYAEIEVWSTTDVSDALDFVEALIKQDQADNARLDFAIISRKRSQIIPYQILFASKNISFGAAEDLQIFLSEAFEKVLDLLTMKSNFNARRRIGQTIEDLLSLCDVVRRYPLSRSDRESLRSHLHISRATTTASMLDALSNYTGPLKGPNNGGRTSREMASAIQQFGSSVSVAATLMALSENFQGLQVDFGKAEDDVFYTDPPFFYLAEYASRYENDYESFIEDIERAKETLAHVPPFEDEDTQGLHGFNPPVKLMTALRAKGKEFDNVILLDVNEGIWPNKNADNLAQKEAERRVFYVAFTRAKKRLLLLVDEKRPWSPFIKEFGWYNS